MASGAQVALIFGLLLINAVLAGSEVALISLRESQILRLETRGKRGRSVARLARDPNQFLATIQIGITLSGFLASATAAVSLAEPLVPLLSALGGSARAVAVALVTAVLTFVTLIFGELAPKRIAMQRAEQWAYATGSLLLGVARLSRPFVVVLGAATDLVVRISGADPSRGRDAPTQEEVRDLIATGGLYDKDQRLIISGALEAADRVLREVLRPRTEVVAFQDSIPANEVLNKLIASGHSRAPIYTERIDDADRMVSVADLIGEERPVHTVARPVLALPESLGLIDGLRRLQQERTSLAVVIDEYGGVAGIVTIEDLLEELVGEIHDEYDRDVRAVTRHADGSLTVIGQFPLHDLIDIDVVLDEALLDTDAVTIAGLVTEQLERLPRAGDTVELGPYLFRVDSIERRTAQRVTIKTFTASTPDTGDAAGEPADV